MPLQALLFLSSSALLLVSCGSKSGSFWPKHPPMLATLRQSHLAPSFRLARLLAQRAAVSPTASVTAPKPVSVKYPYFISRNTRGNLPVYTDVRNGGTRYLVLVRNVDGNIDALARELSQKLFPKDSPEASRIKVEIGRSNNLVITGGRWKNDVVEYLKAKGF
ncbi:putative mitochondrial large subunit ribosomal protein (Img2) [Lyophyllum shimeji]|uniref:Large ribosomal subunit protein mL49 n=1 Tax=Lyophyllum shimeji TaxID=47721 RepID=A0A9P3PFL4_LYOSH|nr:putative mitochondrial large subunit ribosomal protein (Img2) [Lyophyllum shimeji]